VKETNEVGEVIKEEEAEKMTMGEKEGNKEGW